jgi:hypothetical protein
MISDDSLFEHPAKKKGVPLFGASPPPPPPPPPPPLPPLEQAKHKNAVEKLIAACDKLLTAAGVSSDELLRVLRERLSGLKPAPSVSTEQVTTNGSHHSSGAEEAVSDSQVEDLILRAAASKSVVPLAELRHEMPPQYQGKVFDATVLALASKEKVIISQDTDPARFSPAERAEFVCVDDLVFTTLMRRG